MNRNADRCVSAGWRCWGATLTLTALLVGQPAWAGSAVLYGIITGVDLEAKGKIDGKGEDGKASAYCVLWLLGDSNNGD
jgi:hypothetical protein